MFKKIALVCMLFSVRNIFYGDHVHDHIDVEKDQVANNGLIAQNNEGMLRVEIPRRRQGFDRAQAYSNIKKDINKACCNCNCKENADLCGVCCVSFIFLKCLCG